MVTENLLEEMPLFLRGCGDAMGAKLFRKDLKVILVTASEHRSSPPALQVNMNLWANRHRYVDQAPHFYSDCLLFNESLVTQNHMQIANRETLNPGVPVWHELCLESSDWGKFDAC